MAATTVAPHTHGPGAVPEQSRGDRKASYDVADFPPPTGREEDWRFTPLDRLGGLLEGPASAARLELSTDLPDGVRIEIAGAGDASATGRFDDEQLFYLQARGIPEDEARRLVVRGFFNELIQQIGVPEVSARLMTAIDAELAQTMGPGTGSADAPEVTAEARA